MINDDKKKVNNAAFETLCLILSKDSSTAIILNSYLDSQVYNSISERCLSGILATVNYDGIVEFPTAQSSSNSNHLIYRSSYSQEQDNESVHDREEIRKHTQSIDTNYNSNPQNKLQAERINKFGSVADFDKTNSTMQSVGGKIWLPGFNMTASSIKSEQSVRVSQEPYTQTPNQFTSKANASERMPGEIYEKKTNYTPEVHQSKPRTFANVANPSMTTHSLNVAPVQTHSFQNPATDSTRSNTFYSRDTLSKANQAESVSDKLKILKSTSKSKAESNHMTHSPISQNHKQYPDNLSLNHKASTLSDYNPSLKMADKFSSEKKVIGEHRFIHNNGPIRATEFNDIPSHASLKTEALPSETGEFDDGMSDVSKQHRYSQHSGKSLETRNRNKNSFSQKKPPIKTKKSRTDALERPLSVEAKDDDEEENLSDKVLTPENAWKKALSDIEKKNDWERQFKACTTIRDFSIDHKKFFTPSDPYFSEIIQSLSTLCNSLRTQLSRNALGTFAAVFENLGKKIDCILDGVIPMLLKKAADTNAFIAEEAEKALVKACENCSEVKLVAAALSLSKTKINGVKEKILVAINTIIEKLQDKIKTFKDKEKIVSFLTSSMNEAAIEVRNAARSGFLILKACLPDSEFEKLIMRSTSEREYLKIAEFIEKDTTQTDKFMMTNGTSTKGTFYYNKTRMSKMSKQSSSNDYGELEQTTLSNKTVTKVSKPKGISSKISSASSGYGKSNFEQIDNETMFKFDEIIKKFQDTDWKKRVAGLKSLSNFIQEEETLINKSKKFFQIIDVLVQCLKDNNTKVVAASQDIFSNIMNNIKTLIEKGATQIIEGLASNVVSSNSLINN